MKFNEIDFNEAWMKTKTLAEFKEHEKHHNLSDKQLEEVYHLVMPLDTYIDHEEIKKDGDNNSDVAEDAEPEH